MPENLFTADKNISISILGTCISRDIFGMQKNDGGYKIDRFIQSISPISAVTESMLIKNIEENYNQIDMIFSDLSNFYKRVLISDLKKNVFEYMSEIHSDYLLIDAGTMRYNLVKYIENNSIEFLSIVFPKKIKLLKENGFIPNDTTTITLDDISDEEFNEYMDRYINEMLKIYTVDRIILLECEPALLYLKKDKTYIDTFQYDTIFSWKKNIDKGYRYLRKKLSGCHIIEFPDGIIADENHKWGRSSLHYVREYYDYAFEAIKQITYSGLTYAEERNVLCELKEKCEDLVKNRYGYNFARTFRYYDSRNNLCLRMTSYEKYMKELVLDENKIYRVKKFFQKNKYKHCAFYGFGEISKLYIPFFKKWGISVDYIIEETNRIEYEGIPIIKKRMNKYPDVQVMIIADIVAADQVKERLEKMGLTYPVLDAYEIFNG